MLALLEEIPSVLWWGLGLAGLGSAANSAGNGVNSAGNGVLKLAVGAAAIWYVAKKVR